MNLAMNTAMNTAGNALGKLTTVAGNDAPSAAGTGAPQALSGDAAVKPDALPAGAGAAPTGAPGQAPATHPAALPFGHWVALDSAREADVATPEIVTADADAVPHDDAAPALDAAAPDHAEAIEQTVAPETMLAAMAPTMVPMMMPVTLPAMMLAMRDAHRGNGESAVPAAGSADASPAIQVSGAAPALPPGAAGVWATPTPAELPPVAAAPAMARPEQAAAAAPVAARTFEQAAPESVDATPITPGAAVNATASQTANARSADSIVLAGPPTAWRQNLHEALGERLQLQLGRNIDQATIRLEPPMLGRIDIAIRHSGGNLEIHIAASNSDVLRQLNAVSDSLRSDLAGRQYSSVSVNVSDVPRMQASAQTGGQTPGQGQADAQGRSRQDQEQARTPGRALQDEAAAGATLFSMN